MVLFYHRTYTPPSSAFLAGVHSCAVWARMQYISPRFRGFLCILHKNTRRKPIKFVEYFLKLWFFGFQPQYVVDFDPFYPTKSPTYCGFTQFAFRSKRCYTMLAQSKTATRCPPRVSAALKGWFCFGVKSYVRTFVKCAQRHFGLCGRVHQGYTFYASRQIHQGH